MESPEKPEHPAAPLPEVSASTRARCSPTGCDAMPVEAKTSGPRNADEFGLNLPLPWEENRGKGLSTPCIVKLYDADEEALQLGEIVEVLGVLCIDPDAAEFGTMSFDALLEDARHPSTALVPRLHTLLFRRLPFHNPLLPFTPDFLTEARLALAWQRQFAEPAALAAARAATLRSLQMALGGDATAAEYMLMLLVSRSFDT